MCRSLLARLTVTYAASLATGTRAANAACYQRVGTSLLLVLAVSAVTAWGIRRELTPLRELAVRANADLDSKLEFSATSRCRACE